MTASRKKKTVINTVAGVVSRFSSIIFNFILRTIFIYTLGVQYTGVSSVFSDLLNVLSISELGISTAITTALYKPLHDKDKIKIQKIMNFYKSAYRLIALFIFVVGLMLIPFLDNIITKVPDIKESITIIYILYIIKTSSSYLLIYKTTILNADQKNYIIVKRELVCTIIKYIIEIIILIVFKNFIVYLLTEIIATIIQNQIITNKAVTQYPYAFKNKHVKLSKEEKKQLFRNIKGLSMYQIAGTVCNSIDNILISTYIGTVISGIYSSYLLIRRQIEALIKQFFRALTPSIGNLITEENKEKQYIVFKKTFYISFVIMNFCAVSMFVLFTPFIKLWIGENYLLSNIIAFLIAFDSFLYILLQAISSFRTANGLFIQGQYRPLITTIINVILSIILIKKYGIIGTLIATLISRILTQWYDPYLLYKDIFNKLFRNFYSTYLYYIIIFLTSCLVTYHISNLLVIESGIIDLLYKSVCCFIIPNLLAILLTYKKEEFKYFKNMLFKKIKILKGKMYEF